MEEKRKNSNKQAENPTFLQKDDIKKHFLVEKFVFLKVLFYLCSNMLTPLPARSARFG